MNSKDNPFKVITLGTYGAGKTSLITKASNPSADIQELSASILGIDSLPLSHPYKGDTYHFSLKDTAGQERFNNLNRAYYTEADVVLLVYDISNKRSFDDLELFYADFNSTAPQNAVMVMVGTKSDKPNREVQSALPQAHADILEIPFVECSSVTGENISNIFDQILDELLAQERPSLDSKIRLSVMSPSPRKKCKC